MVVLHIPKGMKTTLKISIFFKTSINQILVDFAESQRVSKLTELISMFLFNPFHATGLFLYPLGTRGFLRFSGGIERDQWHERGQRFYFLVLVIDFSTRENLFF